MIKNQFTQENITEKFTFVKSIQSRTIKKVKRKLPQWLNNPDAIGIDCEDDLPVGTLLPSLLHKLKQENIHHLFPVQSAVIKEILKGCGALGVVHGRLGFRPRDLCCSAPTGSGKTLAYVLPILQVLMGSVNRQVRCLVVLPTADLASQVARVFNCYAENTNVKIGLINGIKSFHAEQNKIINNGGSDADVLVGTPGRLVDHITSTLNFNLTHLRFLVLDEADRMMDEVKQDWLAHMQRAVYQNNLAIYSTGDTVEVERLNSRFNCENSGERESLVECRRSSCDDLSLRRGWLPNPPLHKLLFSATLSHDPEKLNQLGLYRPKLLQGTTNGLHHQNSAHSPPNKDANRVAPDEDNVEYVIPSSLQEMFVECERDDKAVMLVHLMRKYEMQRVLCFTNSKETTRRLNGLLRLVGCEARHISSSLPITRRARILQQFHNKRIHILLCTDGMCRGMDVAGVDWVVNYDAPRYARTYVHRAGRTARARQPGTCLSILERKEILHFKRTLVIGRRVKETKVGRGELAPLRPNIQHALQQLQQHFNHN